MLMDVSSLNFLREGADPFGPDQGLVQAKLPPTKQLM